MTILKVLLVFAIAANAVAFPCRTMGGTTVYPYAYFTANPMRNKDARLVIGTAPEASSESDEDDMAPSPAPVTVMETTTMPPTTTTMPPTTTMPRTTRPRPSTPRTRAPTTTSATTTTMPPTTMPPTTRPPSTMSTGGSMPPNDSSAKQICVACAKENFDEVNRYRASLGLSQMRWDDKMAAEAAEHSKDMFERDYFEHSDLPYWENIAYNWGTNKWADIADGFFSQWKKSPGHDRNMKTSTHVCGGVGIYGDGNKFYGTQVFSNKC